MMLLSFRLLILTSLNNTWAANVVLLSLAERSKKVTLLVIVTESPFLYSNFNHNFPKDILIGGNYKTLPRPQVLSEY